MNSFVKFFILCILIISKQSIAQYSEFDYPFYFGKDLGVHYQPLQSTIKVWAPNADQVKLRLYKEGEGDNFLEEFLLNQAQNGIWELQIKKDIKNLYYTFQVQHKGKWLAECADIYAKAVGVNGKRAMVISLSETNPKGWDLDKKPSLINANASIIYESHVRDFSIAANSGIYNKGKYLAFTEMNTKSSDGLASGIAHLKELGITHIHLLPTYDFNSIDENKPELGVYNWGYDPVNYTVPEGSYSTNPYDGKLRIKEFKEMVLALHQNGIRVILDMVFNHTANLETPFNQFVPDYFYRKTATGAYSNASGCGNETASERPMMRKFMIESAAYWANEYHVDGFRFDLMGVHDLETMNAISDSLHKIDSTIFIYGEGWTAGSSPYAEENRAVKKNTFRLNKIAAFSDELRDGLHGPYNRVQEIGYASGAKQTKESVKFGIVAATQHPQINYEEVNYSKAPWAREPYQCINYVSCHDDHTLFDRLREGNPDATDEELMKMDKLSQAIVFTSQGVPFLHSGAEMLRSKSQISNSYNAPDSINEIDWHRKAIYKEHFNYYSDLVKLRKHHPAFRMPTAALIQKHLKFIETKDSLLIAYQLLDYANGDNWKNILVIFNGEQKSKNFNLPPGNWMLVSDENKISERGIWSVNSQIKIPPTTAIILHSLE
jgi:pullulanase